MQLITFQSHRSRPRSVLSAGLLGVLCGIACGQTQQTPVPEHPSLKPQIDLMGTGIATLDLGTGAAFGSNGFGSGSQINFSDSSLSLGISQRMYHGGTGSFTLGALTQDQANSGNQFGLFLHQAFLDYQGSTIEGYVGRTDNPSAQLVTFPTLRGDDLVEFTYLTNPFSNGKNLEEHRYGNIAAATFNQNLRHFENLHVQHLIDSDGVRGNDSTSLNSFGANYQYLALPTMEPLARVVSYGAGFEYRDVPKFVGGASNAVYGGGVFNLQPGLTKRIDLRLLDTFTFGNDTSTFNSIADSYRADGNAVAASLRYLNSPFGLPGYEVSLTAGYKSYNRISGASEFGTALNGTKRLGDGFGAVAQLGYMHRSDALASVYGHRDNLTLQVGLSFNFGSTFNESIGARRTPLNTLYRHITN